MHPWAARNLDSRAGRIAALGEKGCIYLVHRPEVVHITEEYCGFQNAVHADACLCKDRFYIGKGLPGLFRNPFRKRAGCRVYG